MRRRFRDWLLDPFKVQSIPHFPEKMHVLSEQRDSPLRIAQP